jgi:hypothetical protein
MWEKFVGELAASWSLIAAAPLPLVTLMGTEAAIVWAVAGFLSKRKDQIAAQHIKLLEAQVQSKQALADEYLDKLGLQAAQGRVAGLTGAELKQRAIDFVGEARAWLGNARLRGMEGIFNRRLTQEMTEQQRHEAWQAETNAMVRASSEVSSEWDTKFKVRSMHLRDELLKRVVDLPPPANPGFVAHYEHPTNPIGMGMVIDDLERMTLAL